MFVTDVRAAQAWSREGLWNDPERFAAIFIRYFAEIHAYLARKVGTKTADDLAVAAALGLLRTSDIRLARHGAP